MPRDLRTMNSKKERQEKGLDVTRKYTKGSEPVPSDAEGFVAKIVELYFNVRYWFFYTLAIVGLVAYFFQQYELEYVATALCLGVYFVINRKYSNYLEGLFAIVIGGVAGYFVAGQNLAAVCFGILIVFVIRHMIKEIFFWFIRKLVEASKHAE